jgi:hypothetical protein
MYLGLCAKGCTLRDVLEQLKSNVTTASIIALLAEAISLVFTGGVIIICTIAVLAPTTSLAVMGAMPSQV